MATVSSHVLDAVAGCSAKHVRIECTALAAGGNREQIFAVHTDQDGRISESVDVGCGHADRQYELVFHTGDYFDAGADLPQAGQIMRTVVVRVTMPDPQARYHIPVIVGPHSYTVWWSA
ncbi:MAG: hydroxyisourate hydrolase [Gammaproteobacteria bacterium]